MCVTFPVIFQVSLLVSDWQVYYYLHQWLILRKHFYWWFYILTSTFIDKVSPVLPHGGLLFCWPV